MKSKIFWVALSFTLLAFSYVSFAWFKSYRSPQILGKCIHRVDTPIRVVALTFDDGPSEYTEEVLKILNSHEVPATFFLLGQNAERFPSLVSCAANL